MATKKTPQRVKVDLENTEFQAVLFGLNPGEQEDVLTVAQRIQQMTWNDVYKSKGLHWEEITSFKPPKAWGIDPFFSIRVSKERRAVVYRKGDFMVFMALPHDHDSTYDKSWLAANIKP